MEINIATFNQKNVAFELVKKLPADLIGQTSRNILIINGIIKINSEFFFWLYSLIQAKEFFSMIRKKIIIKVIPIIPVSLKS